MEAIADSGWVFSGWSGGLTGMENPDTLEILSDETVTASFMKDSITVTVTTDPVGLEVMVDSVTYISPKVFETTFGSFHRIGAVSPQYGDTIYRFSHWSDGDSIQHSIQVPASDVTYTAFYDVEIPTAIGDLPMPTEVALYQNAPNPFNPTTMIRYDVPVGTSRATLRIYSVAGQLIQTLIDGPVTPGRKSTMWSGKDTRGNPVSSGIYFYRLHAGGRTITKKMVFLK